MKTKKDNSLNNNIKKGDLKMKTKRMITLIAALMLGVMVNAQTADNSILKPTDQYKMDQLKIMVMQYGVDFVNFFSTVPADQAEVTKVSVEKCLEGQDVSQACANLKKRGAKPQPFFPKKPEHNPDKRTQ